MKLTNVLKTSIAFFALTVVVLSFAPAAHAAAPITTLSHGYGHPPVETAIAGFTDQISLLSGIGVYSIGTLLIGSSKIIKHLSQDA